MCTFPMWGVPYMREVASKYVPGILVFCVVPIFLYVTGIGCPIKFLTGVSCPGCGMTRAWIAALSGQFDLAMVYHPLFWTIPLIVVTAMFRERIPRRLYIGMLIVCMVALLAVWVARMFLPDAWSAVVGCEQAKNVVGFGMPRWLEWFTG